VFASKIWLFLLTIGATFALTIALVMPHSANSTRVDVEHTRLGVACGVVNILLAKDARNRVDLAGSFARTPDVVTQLDSASGVDKLDEARMKQVRDVGENVMKTIQGRKPDFVMMVDKRGRVVARVKVDEADFGDVIAGRPLVDDALAGYTRDDLWVQGSTLYLVSAAPVIKKDMTDYAGAIILGHKITQDLATKLVGDLNVDVEFFLGQTEAGGSKTISFDKTALADGVKKLSGDISLDCRANHPFDLKAGNDAYSAIVARLPGEAGAHQAFYSVFVKKPEPRGTWAYFTEARENGGLGFDSFPWLLVGGGFLVALVIGIGLMLYESDRPLRRLAADAVKLAKGESERMNEDSHPGKFGTIARSVNIHIDKLGREAKSAKKDRAPVGAARRLRVVIAASAVGVPVQRCRRVRSDGGRSSRGSNDAAGDAHRFRATHANARADGACRAAHVSGDARRRHPRAEDDTAADVAVERYRAARRPVLQAGLRSVRRRQAQLQRAGIGADLREVLREARQESRRPDGEDALPRGALHRVRQGRQGRAQGDARQRRVIVASGGRFHRQAAEHAKPRQGSVGIEVGCIELGENGSASTANPAWDNHLGDDSATSAAWRFSDGALARHATPPAMIRSRSRCDSASAMMVVGRFAGSGSPRPVMWRWISAAMCGAPASTSGGSRKSSAWRVPAITISRDHGVLPVNISNSTTALA